MRLLVLDDQTLFLESLKGVLEKLDDIESVVTASSEQTALGAAGSSSVDICLVEVGSPRINWKSAITEMLWIDPHLKIAALSSKIDEETVLGLALRGAKGYILKDTPLTDLVWALKRINAGLEVYAPEAQCILLRNLRRLMLPAAASYDVGFTAVQHGGADRTEFLRLSDREREVFLLLADGLSNREIAAEVHVTEGTVKNHVSNILRKLRLSQRSELVAFAWSRGLKGPVTRAAAHPATGDASRAGVVAGTPDPA